MSNAYIVEGGRDTWPVAGDNQWEFMYSRLAKFDGSNRLIIYLQGAFGWDQTLVPAAGETSLTADIRGGLKQLVDEGYVVLNPKYGGHNTWCNDLSLGLIDDWIDYMFTHPLCNGQTKVGLMGVSMGHGAAFNYAIRNQSRVAGVVGVVPVVSLEYMYPTFGTLINQANGLPYGPNSLSLPGTSGSYASTPDAASLDITGDFDIRAEITATDWTPGTNRSIVSKYITSGNQRSYRLRITATGMLEIAWGTTNGSTVLNAISTVAPTVTDGARLAVRATLDVNNGAGGRTTTFYTSSSINGTWTQLGAAVTVAATTVVFAGTGQLEIGSVANGIEAFQGSIHKIEIRNGINGTIVADPDFAQAQGTTSFNDSTGKTYTLQGSATISGGDSATLNATLKAERDPLTRASELNGVIPWHVHYNTDDTLVDGATASPAFVTAIGASATTGTGGHIWNPTMANVISFYAGLNWS